MLALRDSMSEPSKFKKLYLQITVLIGILLIAFSALNSMTFGNGLN